MAFSAGALVKPRGGLYKIQYYECDTWGSPNNGTYVAGIGGIPIDISQLKRVYGVLGATLQSGQGAVFEFNDIVTSSNRLFATLMQTSAIEMADTTALSGVTKLMMAVIGE